MCAIWTEERTKEFMNIFGDKVVEMSKAVSDESMTTEEKRKMIDDMIAYADIMNMVDSARKKQIRRDIKKTLREYIYAVFKLTKIKKKATN